MYTTSAEARIPFSLDDTHAGLEVKAALDTSSARIADTLARLRGDAKGPAAFLEVPEYPDLTDSVHAVAARIPDRLGKVLVLGIGGSALGAQAALDSLGAKPRAPGARQVRILSNLDPVTVADAIEWFDPRDTLLLPITKSGTTVETLTQFAIFADRIRSTLGPTGLAEGVVVVTDPEKGAMRRLVDRLGCASLDVPPRVGGRFSVLTAVGLLPMALAGLDIEGVIRGAAAVNAALDGPDPLRHPSVRAAALQVAMMERGASVRVLWAYCDRLATLGDWFSQLWAESLGKPRGDGAVGQTPLRAIGSTDQHSLLQLFMEGPRDKSITLLTVGGPAPALPVPDLSDLEPDLAEFAGKDVADVFGALRAGTTVGLIEAGRPVLGLDVPRLDAAALGALFQHFEIETALAGYLLGIDPFDQPGVEIGKKYAHGLLGRPGMESYREHATRILDHGKR
jgi:glucose-6-phosphate isomerase